MYIQCGEQNDRSNVLLDLVLQILREPFFHKLRTQVRIMMICTQTSSWQNSIFQEQQGYVVDSLIRRANGAQGIKFVVESSKHPDYIEPRIVRFLEAMTVKILKFDAAKKFLTNFPFSVVYFE
jgi:insulysin